MEKITAVTGASGAQGQAICAELAKLGHQVVGLTRSLNNEMQGAQNLRLANFDDQQSLAAALQGVDSVVYTYPVAFDIELARQRTRRLVDACKEQSVSNITFNASIPQPNSDTGVRAIDLKRMIAEELRQSPLNVLVVAPTIYLGNLLAPWSVSAIAHDRTIVYPLPADTPVSWSTWEDVAVAHDVASGSSSTNVLLSTSKRPALTGVELAELFSHIRHAPHNYVPLPINDFKVGLSAALGDETATELARLYDWLAGEGREYLNQSAADANLTLEGIDKWVARQVWSEA